MTQNLFFKLKVKTNHTVNTNMTRGVDFPPQTLAGVSQSSGAFLHFLIFKQHRSPPSLGAQPNPHAEKALLFSRAGSSSHTHALGFLRGPAVRSYVRPSGTRRCGNYHTRVKSAAFPSSTCTDKALITTRTLGASSDLLQALSSETDFQPIKSKMTR